MDNNGNRRKNFKSIGLLLLRVFMGLAIAYHGYGKIFGGQIEMLVGGLEKMGVPAPHLLGWMAALSEFVGGLCIALGLGTRIAAFFVFFTMSVAFFKAHGARFQEGEMAYLFGIIALSLMFTGGGCYSLGSLFCRKRCHPETPEKEQ